MFSLETAQILAVQIVVDDAPLDAGLRRTGEKVDRFAGRRIAPVTLAADGKPLEGAAQKASRILESVGKAYKKPVLDADASGVVRAAKEATDALETARMGAQAVRRQMLRDAADASRGLLMQAQDQNRLLAKTDADGGRERLRQARMDGLALVRNADDVSRQLVEIERRTVRETALVQRQAVKQQRDAAKQERDAQFFYSRTPGQSRRELVDRASNAALGAGVVGLGAAGYAVSQAARVQTGFINAQNNSPMKPQDFMRYQQTALSLAKQYGADPVDIMRGFMRANNHGLGADAAVSVVTAGTKSAVNTDAKVEDTANLLAQFKKAFGFGDRDTYRAMTGLHIAQTRGNMDMNEMLEHAPMGLGILDKYHLKPADALALITTGTQNSIPLPEMITQLKGIMSGLTNPKKPAQEVLNRLTTQSGIDLTGDIRKLQHGIGSVSQFMIDFSEATKRENTSALDINKVLPNKRGAFGMMALTGKGSVDLRENYGAIRAGLEGQSDPIKAGLDIKLQSFDNQLARTNNAMLDVYMKLSRSLLPVLGKVADDVSRAADAFDRLPKPMQDAIAGTLAYGGALALVAGGAGKAFLGVKGLSELVAGRAAKGAGAALSAAGAAEAGAVGAIGEAGAAGAVAEVGTAGSGAAAALAGLAVPIAVTIAGAVALGAAWKTNFLGIRTDTENVLEWMKPAVKSAFSFVETEAGRVWKVAQGPLLSAWGYIKGGIVEVGHVVRSVFTGMVEGGLVLADGWNWLKKEFGIFGHFLAREWDAAETATGRALRAMASHFDWLSGPLKDIKSLAASVWDGMAKAMDAAGARMLGALGTLGSTISAWWDNLPFVKYLNAKNAQAAGIVGRAVDGPATAPPGMGDLRRGDDNLGALHVTRSGPLGAAIAAAAAQRDMDGTAAQFAHHCQVLARTTAQTQTHILDAFWRGSAKDTALAFARAGLAQRITPQTQFAPGDLLYSTTLGRDKKTGVVSGHVQTVGPTGHRLDQYGQDHFALSNFQYVVHPDAATRRGGYGATPHDPAASLGDALGVSRSRHPALFVDPAEEAKAGAGALVDYQKATLSRADFAIQQARRVAAARIKAGGDVAAVEKALAAQIAKIHKDAADKLARPLMERVAEVKRLLAESEGAIRDIRGGAKKSGFDAFAAQHPGVPKSLLQTTFNTQQTQKALADAQSERERAATKATEDHAAALAAVKARYHEAVVAGQVLAATTDAQRIALTDYGKAYKDLAPDIRHYLDLTIPIEAANKKTKEGQDAAAKATAERVSLQKQLNDELAQARAADDVARGLVPKAQSQADILAAKYAPLGKAGAAQVAALLGLRTDTAAQEANTKAKDDAAKIQATLNRALTEAQVQYSRAAGHVDPYEAILARLNIDMNSLTAAQRAQVQAMLPQIAAVDAATAKMQHYHEMMQRVNDGLASSLANTFEGILSGSHTTFASVARDFKGMVVRMVAEAEAAKLAAYLTGKNGLGGLLQGVMGGRPQAPGAAPGVPNDPGAQVPQGGGAFGSGGVTGGAFGSGGALGYVDAAASLYAAMQSGRSGGASTPGTPGTGGFQTNTGGFQTPPFAPSPSGGGGMDWMAVGAQGASLVPGPYGQAASIGLSILDSLTHKNKPSGAGAGGSRQPMPVFIVGVAPGAMGPGTGGAAGGKGGGNWLGLAGMAASFIPGGGVAAKILGGLGSVFHFAKGGVVPGQGDGDTVPAMLTPQEVVLSRDMLNGTTPAPVLPTPLLTHQQAAPAHVPDMSGTMRRLDRVPDVIEALAGSNERPIQVNQTNHYSTPSGSGNEDLATTLKRRLG